VYDENGDKISNRQSEEVLMRRLIFSLFILVVLLSITASPILGQKPSQTASSAALTEIYFNDSDPEVMILGNDTWEVAFRKTNGGIFYITDKTAGGTLSTGSRNECLWGAWDSLSQYYIGGCSFNRDWSNHFSYSWSGSSNTLTLSYVTDPLAADEFIATVQVVASNSDYFDMQLAVQENYTDGRLFDYMLFPSDLYFSEAEVIGVLLPLLPGVVLKPGFFSEDRVYYWNYPGYPGAFADYIAFSTTEGELTIYSLFQGDPLQPVQFGINNDDAYQPDTYYIAHNFGVMLQPDQLWQSPPVRFRISKPWSETIMDYRLDNGLDQFSSISQKLGSLYDQLIHMPEYRLVSFEVQRKFSQYDSLFFSQLRTPSLLHLVGYQPIGHDHYSPDYLPPDTRWCNVPENCTQEFATMFAQAKARGWLVMPYINPTWWNPDSPTLINLAPLTVEDISVLNRQGDALYETYGVNGGYVVSPYAPFVQSRLDQFMIDMTTLVPSDLIFEDQVGARPWMFDFNPASPSPIHYIQGWIEHTRTYQETHLAAELAFDRLAETEVGFYGSILLPQKLGQTATSWGDNNWTLYPLAQMMSRDKTLFYQHDLDLNTFSDTKSTIMWNLAMGYNLGDDLRLTEGNVHDNPWLKLNGELQDHLLSLYASERITGYTNLTPNVTQTTFQSVRVIANWDSTNPYTTAGFTISPSGALVRDQDSRLTAGILTTFNGYPLSAGDHYLIVKVDLDQISVRQPMGASTSLTLPLPAGWQTSDPIQAHAEDITGNPLGSLALTVSASGITFTYPLTLAEVEVEQVLIVNPNIISHHIYLPIVNR
jgi:hypothetical protein